MTVAEAMAAGTMPVPSAYAALLWPQEEELATLRARIKNLCMPKGDTSLRVQYEELSWSLRQVENLTVLLPRLLSDTSGHYLVLFESAAYQEKLGTELEQPAHCGPCRPLLRCRSRLLCGFCRRGDFPL